MPQDRHVLGPARVVILLLAGLQSYACTPDRGGSDDCLSDRDCLNGFYCFARQCVAGDPLEGDAAGGGAGGAPDTGGTGGAPVPPDAAAQGGAGGETPDAAAQGGAGGETPDAAAQGGAGGETPDAGPGDVGPACVPAEEICNGLDDDCDGEVDEGFDLGSPCQDGVGRCALDGVVVCTEQGDTRCDLVGPRLEPEAETCNGVDDDCDGETDEGVSGRGDLSGDCGADIAMLGRVGEPGGDAVVRLILEPLSDAPWTVTLSMPGRTRASATLLADLDGDRIGDLVVGDPDRERGHIKLVSLRQLRDAPLEDLLGLDLGWPDDSGEGLGGAIVSPGDWSGDGLPEIIASVRLGGSDALAVVTSGQGEITVASAPAGEAGLATLGAALGVCGDLNDDGLADVIVLAPDTGPADRGALLPLLSPAMAGGVPFGVGLLASGFAIGGRMLQPTMRTASQGVGDLDANGQPDFAVAGPDSGLALVALNYDIDPPEGVVPISWIVAQDSPDPRFGAALAIGDLTGDGVADLVITEPGRDRLEIRAGGADAWANQRVPIPGLTLRGPAASSFGDSVAILDVDGDGASDLVVTAGAEGAVYVLRGPLEMGLGRQQVVVDDDQPPLEPGEARRLEAPLGAILARTPP